MQENYKKLGKNTIIMSAGSFAQKLLAFIFVPFYTYVLSTSDYGTSDLIVTLSTLLWPVFTLLIDEAVMRFLLDRDSNVKQIISIGFVLNVLAILVMLICSPSLFLFKNISPYYSLFVLYFISYTLDTYSSYVLRGLQRIKLFSLSGILSTVLVIACNLIFLLVFKLGIKGYLLSYIVAFSLTATFKFFYGKLYTYRVSCRLLDRQIILELLRYSVPLIPNSISWWISNSSDRFILSYFCGTAINGIYTVAYKIPSIINIVSSVFTGAWQISAVDDFGTEKNRKFFSEVYYNLSALYLTGSVVLVTLNKYICDLLFSKEFFSAWKYVPILLGAVYFQNMNAFLGTIYTTAKKTKMILYSTLSAAIVNIVLNFIMIPKFGAYGAAIATLISYFFVWAVRYIDSQRIIKMDIKVYKEIYGIALMALFILDSLYPTRIVYFGKWIILVIYILINKNLFLNILKILSGYIFLR